MKPYKKVIVSFSIAATLMGSASAYAASFKDVKNTHWAYSAVEWGVSKGIVTGFTDKTFKPNDLVSYEEFVALLIRSYKGILTPTTKQRWSDPYYVIARSNNYPVNSKRTDKITRTAVAEIISGTLGKNYSNINAIRFMLMEGLAGGKKDNTVTGYLGNDFLTRAEALVFIKRLVDKSGGLELQVRPAEESDTSYFPLIDDYVKDAADMSGVNEELQASYARKISSVVSNLGFVASYNSTTGETLVKTMQGKTVLSYNDGSSFPGRIQNLIISDENEKKSVIDQIISADNSNGMQSLSLIGMLAEDGSGEISKDKLQVVLAVMDSLGLPSNSSISEIIKSTAIGGKIITGYLEIGGTLIPLGDGIEVTVEGFRFELYAEDFGEIDILIEKLS